MKQKTLLLFQLFLAVFAIYAVLKYSGNQRLLVPLTCLFTMFVLGKVETAVAEKDKKDQNKKICTALVLLLSVSYGLSLAAEGVFIPDCGTVSTE